MSELTHQNGGHGIMTTTSRIASKAVVRTLVVATATAAVIALSSAALAQDQAQFGTADEAKAMLINAAAAVKADRAKALAMISKGEGGFLDRDLHPFCANVSDGKFVARNNGDARQHLGQDIRTLVDLRGKTIGQAQFAAAQKPEGDITEVSYFVPNSGAHTTPLPKVSVTTRVGDLVCGVSYYPSAAYWVFEQAGG